ncbi:MAG: F0F1 ATP synthase subunit A [Nitrospira sp.]|nr:F0F1 ATP synthase subunit A [Candidatus Manganitrophaceae bacterium]HIL35478.1 ATP synthase F0 subunit A [Candidatus Manganitrophaceae bacterium]
MAEEAQGIDPLHHFELHSIYDIHIAGIDFSINQAVIWIWIAAAVVFALFVWTAKTQKRYPKGKQNLVESVLDFLMKEIVLKVIGEEGRFIFPFIATLFLFILTSSLLGLIPGSFTPVANINVTAGLALMVFVTVQGVGVKKHGLVGYLKGFIPPGVPSWILPLMLPIEFIGQLAKPLSLAIRLFANMLAGHIVILVFLSLIILLKSIPVTPLPIVGVVIMSAFEIFVALIQSFIFSILTATYFSAAIHMEH